jgi:tagaturonate reductase
MKLSRYTLKNISTDDVVVPDESVFNLPEKVLQFGTGVLMRGLPDYFIDKANREGKFNGRIVVVKSTLQGDTLAYDKQDSLYTHCLRGITDGMPVEENIINSSISRVLNAPTEWKRVLECAHNSHLQVIISNTTEVGIQLVNDDIRSHPPTSFPGKLLAFLYERFQAFDGSERSGMLIIPTELIVDNGNKLQSIVLELAHLNSLPDDFIEWLENHNHFCNSLVDRIVPGKPTSELKSEIESTLGFTDELLIMSEVYRLWAIEGDEKIKNILSFAAADESVVIVPDINIYRELKLRLLNGTHTLSCGLAFLAGCETVNAAMEDETISHYISSLMQFELAPAIPYSVELPMAISFGESVLERFRNPYIQHKWISITMNYSAKMKLRCVPMLLNHYLKSDQVPELFALGFAAYIAFMKPVTKKGNDFYGLFQHHEYPVQDEMAEVFYKRWEMLAVPELVKEVLADHEYWGADLHLLPGFQQSVTDKLNQVLQSGIKSAVEDLSNIYQAHES